MSITHGTATRDAIANLINTQVNAGGAGTLTITDASDVTLVTIALSATAFGTSSNGIITMNGTPLSASATAGGIAAKFTVKSGAGTMIFQGTVATTGGDLTIDNTNIAVNQTVRITSLTYSAPL